MVPFLFSMVLTFCSPALVFAASPEIVQANMAASVSSEESIHYLQVQDQEPVEQVGDEETMKPYEGFNLVAFGMIAVVLLIVAFVVVKVFQRMNKSRKGEM